jgi:uncharacterized protein
MREENHAIAITSIIAGVILVIAILFLFVFKPVSSSSGNTVTVQGISTIKATPDVISISFNIETKGDTSAEATTANNKIHDTLVEKLILLGFDEKDIKTESFNVYPNTYWDNGKEKTDGYKANHYLKVEVSSENLSKLSPAIDAGVNAGAGISYINFELSQDAQNEYKAQALKEASQDAMIKADSIASGFDKKAGKLVSVQTSDFGYYPWNVYTASGTYRTEDAAMAKQVATNIQPSEQDITATITATFKLR